MTKQNVSFLFGNLKKGGEADTEDRDKDFRNEFELVENYSEYLDPILSIDVGVDRPKESQGDDELVLPDAAAIDYTEEQELAEDLLPQGPTIIQATEVKALPTVFYPQIQAPSPAKIDLATIFPSFVPGGRLKFSELFASKATKAYPYLRLDKLKNS